MGEMLMRRGRSQNPYDTVMVSINSRSTVPRTAVLIDFVCGLGKLSIDVAPFFHRFTLFPHVSILFSGSYISHTRCYRLVVLVGFIAPNKQRIVCN